MKKLLICLLFSRLLNASYNYTEVQDLSQLKIETPSLSNREVGKIRLANGLDVYLVSDKDTDKSAAAFAVNVGSWSDPKDYPGMAHFVEHLLFLSTKAYPKEDEFLEFIDERGGKWNAYTSTDRTVYMFSVNHNGFKEGLDRFAHFFIDPLMSESGVGRELHAVDQEHDKNIENDLWREWYIFKETGNPNHPNVSFSTGTAKTLGKIPLKDVKGWFQNHYGANHAKLIVYSHLPMDELKALTAKTFKELPVQMNSVSIPYGELTSAKQKGHITYIQPIKDLRSYSINWELPRNIALDSETHATDLIAQVLRYKGENSLYASLKSKGYIESLSVFSEKFSKDHEMFALNFSLTKNGINHLDEISKETFEFLQFIKKDGVPEYIFNETKKIAKIDYAYQSRSNAFTYVREKASELLDEPLETYPRKTLIPSYYSKEQIQKVLQALTPESALYTAMLPLDMVGLKPTKKEKWNHGEYTVKKIPEETLASWSMQTEETSFTIRKENPFIPTNLNLLAKQEDEPSLVVNETFGKMYFFQETEYQVPESHIILNFFSEELDGSCKKQVLTDIYIKEINERLAPINSEARAGGLNAMAYQSDFSIAIRVDGYSEKSLLLLANTLEKMQDFTLSKKKFDLHKSALLSAYENADKELLYQQVVKLSGSILTNTSHLSSLKARAIRHLQYEDFVAFSESLFLKTYIEGLATGNLEQKQVVKIWNMAKNSVQAQPFPKEKHFQKKF